MSPSLKSLYGTNPQLERDGVWIENFPTTGMRIKLARAGTTNPRFRTILERLTKPHRRAIVNETIDPELSQDLMMQVYAQAVIVGWEGIPVPVELHSAQEECVPYSPEAALRLLRSYPDLYNDIQELAGKLTTFQQTVREDAAGNS